MDSFGGGVFGVFLGFDRASEGEAVSGEAASTGSE